MEKKTLAAMMLTLASGLAFAADMSSSGMSSDRMSGSSASGASAFDRLDTNKDGTLSRSEFDVHVQEMQRMKSGHHGSGKMSGSSSGDNVEDLSPQDRQKQDRMERQSSQHGQNPTATPDRMGGSSAGDTSDSSSTTTSGDNVDNATPQDLLKQDRMERQSSQHGENPTATPDRMAE